MISLLKLFPLSHHQVKLLTFNINTRLNYFLRTASPEVTSTIIQQLDTSVDNFWANTLHFPPDYQNNQYANDYANALRPFNKFDWEFVKGDWDVTITRISYTQHIIVQWQTHQYFIIHTQKCYIIFQYLVIF